MKILLLGANGQVGWELQRALAPLGELVALGRHGAAGLAGDLGQPSALAQTLNAVHPDIIVNAAAYTAVDRAESEPDLCRRINAEAPALLAEHAHRTGTWLVHYSTDYVFDGSGERAAREDDTPRPINIYGRTKFEGEQAIIESGCRHLIFRTSWVYAARGANFLRTMLRLARERDTLDVIADQYGAPTGAELIADVTAHALTLAPFDSDISGIYHLAAAGETTWHGYASHLIGHAHRCGMAVCVDPAAIAAIATEELPRSAPRPRNSRLDCARLESAFRLTLPPWQTGVERVVEELSDQP